MKMVIEIPDEINADALADIIEEAMKRRIELPLGTKDPVSWVMVLSSIMGRVSWSLHDSLQYPNLGSTPEEYRNVLLTLIAQSIHALHDYDTQLEGYIHALQQANPEGMGNDS